MDCDDRMKMGVVMDEFFHGCGTQCSYRRSHNILPTLYNMVSQVLLDTLYLFKLPSVVGHPVYVSAGAYY